MLVQQIYYSTKLGAVVQIFFSLIGIESKYGSLKFVEVGVNFYLTYMSLASLHLLTMTLFSQLILRYYVMSTVLV